MNFIRNLIFSSMVAFPLAQLSATETEYDYKVSGTGYDLMFKINDDGSSVRLMQIEVSGYDAEIQIPELVEGYKVSDIGQRIDDYRYTDVEFEDETTFCSVFDAEYTDSDCLSEIKSLAIPGTVSSIWPCAFDGSSFVSGGRNFLKLSTISIPESVQNIGASAFQYAQIDEINLPNSITNVYNNTFRYCSSLKKVVLGDNVKELWASAFGDAPTISEIYINSAEAPKVNSYAFSSECTAKVYVPNGSLDDYENKWKSYTNFTFVEMESGQTSGVETISMAESVTDTVIVYDIYGRRLLSGERANEVQLPSGLYIVKSGSNAEKIWKH